MYRKKKKGQPDPSPQPDSPSTYYPPTPGSVPVYQVTKGRSKKALINTERTETKGRIAYIFMTYGVKNPKKARGVERPKIRRSRPALFRAFGKKKK